MNIIFNGSTGTIKEDGNPTSTLLTNQWVTVTINVDLDADTATVDYGATNIYTGAWVVEVNAPVLPFQYQGIDFWADGGAGGLGGFYVDNFKLVHTPIPEPGALAFLGLAMGGLMLRRRQS